MATTLINTTKTLMFTRGSNINNGELKGTRPQPSKFNPADSSNFFSMNRTLNKRAIIGKKNPSFDSTSFSPVLDSSQITQRRKICAVGKSSFKTTLGADAKLSLGHCHNNNTLRSAKRRVRSSGCVAPAKKGAY